MTENKRFTIDDESDIIEFDWHNNEYIADYMWGDGKSWDRLCNRLNELNDENTRLKDEVYDWKASAEDYLQLGKVLQKENKELKEENEQLKQSYKEFEDECQSTFNAMSRKQNDLYRKNFKLKEENERLKRINKGQELEIVRLHKLADRMSGVLRELGIYDVYDDETIEEIKNKVKGDCE